MSKKRGKPFVKGDPRINRKGRPKNSDKLKALILQVLHEPAIEKSTGEPLVKEGRVVTNVEAIVRTWLASNQELLMAYAFGKPKTEIDIDGDISVSQKPDLKNLTVEQLKVLRDTLYPDT